MDTVQIAAGTGYFFSVAGFVWILCERASDWGTRRWSNGARAFSLIFGAIGLLAIGLTASSKLLGVTTVPEEHAWSVLFGIVGGLLGYWCYRRFVAPRPGDKDLD